MVKLLQVAGFVFLLTACAGPAFGQTSDAFRAQAEQEKKAELYGRLAAARPRGPADQRAIYEIGKEYLRKYGEPEDDIVRYVRKWVLKYEAAVRRFYQERVPKLPDGPQPVCRRRAVEVPSIPK